MMDNVSQGNLVPNGLFPHGVLCKGSVDPDLVSRSRYPSEFYSVRSARGPSVHLSVSWDSLVER